MEFWEQLEMKCTSCLHKPREAAVVFSAWSDSEEDLIKGQEWELLDTQHFFENQASYLGD